MKISYGWLKEFVAIESSPEETGKKLTSSGLEVESIEKIESIPGGLEGIVLGEVLTCAKHPNADSLSVTTVDIGAGEPVAIVCGAPNVAAGQKVAVATVNATLYPKEGEPFKIKKAKIRGEVSEGMICAEDEIGLGKSHDGIMVLNTTLPNGTPAARYFNLEADYVFEIGLTPNRADAASHYGVARDLRALLDKEITLPKTDEVRLSSVKRPFKIVIENEAACPRYAGITVSGITVQESPDWLKRKLKAIGLSPINNIVDITNYVLHGLGQPLHAFDADKVAKDTIIVKTTAQDTPFRTLDNVERKLNANDLMICDGNGKPMCIAGVFGGIDSGISDETKTVFIESAYFSPEYVRKTAQFHGLKTDASFRFERGTDPNIVPYAARYAAKLMCEIAGGEIASDLIDVYPNPIDNFQFTVKYRNIDRLIGKRIPHDRIKSILQSLDIKIVDSTSESLTVSVPPYRVDVKRDADIVEEILRIYGFDNIELSENLNADYLANFPEIDTDKVKLKTAQSLAGNGFHEILTNSLTSSAYAALIPSLSPEENVEILNKSSNELSMMRRTLIFSGLEVIKHNGNRRRTDLKLFEFGKIYHKVEGKEGKTVYKERQQLALFMTGNRNAETWQAKSEKIAYSDLANEVSNVFQKLQIQPIEQTEIADDIFEYGIAVSWRKKTVAKLGLLRKNLTKALDLKQEVFYAELEWEYLCEKFNSKIVFEELSKYPEVRRDLSLVLNKKTSFEEIRKASFAAEKNILQRVNVFDVYEGENIGADKKSYSVSFILQDKNQTLTEEMIDKTMQKLMNAFESQLEAVIRK